MVKLNPAAAKQFIQNPDASVGALLIYGPDSARVDYGCKAVVDKLAGAKGREEMRIVSVAPEAVTASPASLATALKSQSFFPGRIVVQLSRANEAIAKAIEDALAQRGQDDAFLVATAGSLRPASKLRKLFETHQSARCAPVYADAPTVGEVGGLMRKAGIAGVENDALEAVAAFARDISPQELDRFIEKMALYKLGESSSVSVDDVEACAPATGDVLVDRLLDQVAAANMSSVATVFRQVAGRGQDPVSVCILATALFRRIHQVASDPDGLEAGAGRLRPPVFGPRKRQIIDQALRWKVDGSEAALKELIAADRTLRSGAKGPAKAYVERILFRVAQHGAK